MIGFEDWLILPNLEAMWWSVTLQGQAGDWPIHHVGRRQNLRLGSSAIIFTWNLLKSRRLALPCQIAMVVLFLLCRVACPCRALEHGKNSRAFSIHTLVVHLVMQARFGTHFTGIANHQNKQRQQSSRQCYYWFCRLPNESLMFLSMHVDEPAPWKMPRLAVGCLRSE